MSCLIIAEAGVNHNGVLENALALIDVAADSGVDVVKFQSFKTEKLVTAQAAKAPYQQRNLNSSGSQQEMLKRLEISESDHFCLFEHCKKRGVRFLSTPFDSESLRFLIGNGLIEIVKVPSGEITNLPFLLEIARHHVPMILSTGMATLSEIELALATIAFGLVESPSARPSIASFWSAYWSQEGQNALRRLVTVLHCTTEYPAYADSVNLRAMETLSKAFALPVGFSDHSQGVHIPVAAVALGACVVEKHFTLSRGLPGPDHKASLEPDELVQMVSQIRGVEAAMGNGLKIPVGAELDNRKAARKIIVASREIAHGEILDSSNMTTRRGAAGLAPMFLWELIGTKAVRAYFEGDPIETKGGIHGP